MLSPKPVNDGLPSYVIYCIHMWPCPF